MRIGCIALLVAGLAGDCFARQQAVIAGAIGHFDKDSVQISVLEDAVTRRLKQWKVPVVAGRFTTSVALHQPSLVSITDGELYVNGMIDHGDNLQLSFDAPQPAATIRVQGKGREAFLLLNELSAAGSNVVFNQMIGAAMPRVKAHPFPFDYLCHLVDSFEQYFMDRLSAITNVVSRPAARLLEGEINGTFYLNNTRSLFAAHYESEVAAGKRNGQLADRYRFMDSLLPSQLRLPVMTLFLLGDIKQDLSPDDYASLDRLIYQGQDDNGYRS